MLGSVGSDLWRSPSDPPGEFWAVEEYGPSLVRIDAGGWVLRRFMPHGLQLDGADYPVSATLPGIFSSRTPNRGFEGLTLSADGATLYLAIQSPLSNPDSRTVNRFRNIRILAFDVTTERVTAEYVYRLGVEDEPDVAAQPAPQPKPERAARPAWEPRPAGQPAAHQLRVSALASVGPTTLLVLERTSTVAKVYLADLSSATNILGSAWGDPMTTPSLEASVSLAET